MRVDELRELRRDVEVTFPHLGACYAGQLTALPVTQPWFSRHQVLRFDALQATGLGLFAVRGERTVALLSGRLDRLDDLVARETPRGVDAGSVVAYAEDCDGWTARYDVRPTAVTSVDDILRMARRAVEAERMALLAQKLEPELRPPVVTRAGDDTIVTRCVLAGAKLVRRRLTVTRAGALRRDDFVLVDRLPLTALAR